MLSCVKKLRRMTIGNSHDSHASWRFVDAAGNQVGFRKTIRAPTVMPNMAIEIATNAK